jgi:hypothetical protein
VKSATSDGRRIPTLLGRGNAERFHTIPGTGQIQQHAATVAVDLDGIHGVYSRVHTRLNPHEVHQRHAEVDSFDELTVIARVGVPSTEGVPHQSRAIVHVVVGAVRHAYYRKARNEISWVADSATGVDQAHRSIRDYRIEELTAGQQIASFGHTVVEPPEYCCAQLLVFLGRRHQVSRSSSRRGDKLPVQQAVAGRLASPG